MRARKWRCELAKAISVGTRGQIHAALWSKPSWHKQIPVPYSQHARSPSDLKAHNTAIRKAHFPGHAGAPEPNMAAAAGLTCFKFGRAKALSAKFPAQLQP